MIYITGDCHGNFRRFSKHIFPEQKEMTKDDYVIICGDFGGIWDKGKSSKGESKNLDELNDRPFTTLFVCGNHENFDRLYSYPVEEWHGGKVHKIRDSVYHLMRGQVFELEDLTFFTFGGAQSHDISGGILDPEDPLYGIKRAQLNRGFRPYRINHVSWWKEELPSQEEMEEGWRNLEAHDYEVDFIVSHCAATSNHIRFGDEYQPDILTDYLEEVRRNVYFRKWFFGHYHENINIDLGELVLYEQIIRVH